MGEEKVWGVLDVRRSKWLGEDDCLFAVRDESKARATAAMQSSLRNRPYEARPLPESIVPQPPPRRVPEEKAEPMSEIEANVRETIARHPGYEPELERLIGLLDAMRAENAELQAERDEAVRKRAAMSEELTCEMSKTSALRAKLRIVEAVPDAVWRWQGCGDDSQSLSCPVVMSADTLRAFVATDNEAASLRAETAEMRKALEEALRLSSERGYLIGMNAIAAVASAALRAAERPDCSGKWVGGSGGHRQHEPCGEPADWWHPDDAYAYCDEHMGERDERTQYRRWGAAEKAPEAREPVLAAADVLTAEECQELMSILADGALGLSAANSATCVRLLPRVRAAAEKAGK